MTVRKITVLEAYKEASEGMERAEELAETLLTGIRQWRLGQKAVRQEATFTSDPLQQAEMRNADIQRMASLLDLMTQALAPEIAVATNYRDLGHRGGGMVDRQ